MKPEAQAGVSEARLVLWMGSATLLVLVGMMALSAREAPSAMPDDGTLEQVQAELAEARVALAEAVQAREGAEARLAEALAAAEEDGAWDALTDENARLHRRVRELTEEIAALTGTPVVAERAGLPVARTSGVLAPRVLQNVRVVDVNPGIGYAVIDVGEEHGVRPGMQFAVMRDGRTVARVTAEDVREVLTGVSVSLADGGTYPLPGDRAILTTNE